MPGRRSARSPATGTGVAARRARQARRPPRRCEPRIASAVARGTWYRYPQPDAVARGGQPYRCLFQQRTRGVEAAGTKRGPARHGGTEQLSRAREVGCLLAHALGHLKGVGNPAGQQQCADVCVGDVEPHVRSVERASRDGVSRVCDGHGFGGAARVRGDRGERPGYLGADDWGRSSNARSFDACVAASGRSIANQYTVRKASI